VATIIVGVLLLAIACCTVVLSSGTEEAPEQKGVRAKQAESSERTFHAVGKAAAANVANVASWEDARADAGRSASLHGDSPKGKRKGKPRESRAAENLSGSQKGRQEEDDPDRTQAAV
jgi:hypothetical protein